MLDVLIRRGYLPLELPPLFDSRTFADCIAKSKGAPLPSHFIKTKAPWSVPTHHNLQRVGGMRRRLSTPNPHNIFRLANLFDAEAEALKKSWRLSPYSRTRPRLSKIQQRALAQDQADRAVPQALIRASGRYLLRADVAQFYPSIYSHTISWVLHTKAVAKKLPIDKTLFGNRLDEELRAGQYGQTKGVPIGPDTSLGIAELLLGHVDSGIRARCRPIAGIRYIDDFELTFRKLADAEKALLVLEEELYALELQLNAPKTRIVELPAEIESAHITELRSRVPRAMASRSNWIDFFNSAFSLAKEFPTEAVLRYAVASLSRVAVSERHWLLVQSLLWQSLQGDSGVLRFIIDVLWNQTRNGGGLTLDAGLAKQALGELIVRSAPAGHGSEVVWALWAAILFDVKLSATVGASVSVMDDSFVAVAATYASRERSVLRPFTSDLWKDWLQPKCFADTNWLFAYEAYRRGWYDVDIAKSELDKDDSCKFLKDHGVTFVNDGVIGKYTPRKRPPQISGGGISGP
jgi:hypothetical protein